MNGKTRYYVIEWYEESEEGDLLLSGKTVFAGSLNKCSEVWGEHAATYSFCTLHPITKEQYEAYMQL